MKHAVVLSLAAFVAHFLWETVQCPLFFVHGTYDATWRGMIVASLGDVVITWILYAAIAARRRDWRWPSAGWRSADWVVFSILAVAVGFAIEMRALHEGRWRYTPETPLVPGTDVSIVPIVQLLILTPAVIWLSEVLIRRRRSRD